MNLNSSLTSLQIMQALEKLGIGAEKSGTFFLPNFDLNQTKVLLANFCQEKKWSLIDEKIIDGLTILILQAGQWGFKFSGSQNVYVAVNQEPGGMRGVITSKSTMGQLLDWGANQKNIDALLVFFKENPTPPPPSQPVVFTPRKPTINSKFFQFIIAATVLASIIALIKIFSY